MSELVKYIIALSNLYGMVSKELVVSIYNSQNEDQISIEEVKNYLKNLPAELEKLFIYPHRGHFVKEVILEFDEFELMMHKKLNKPYYIPNKKELLTYLDEDYYKKKPHYNRLLNYIKKNFSFIAEEEIEEILEEIYYTCASEFDMQYIFAILNHKDIVFESEKQLGDMISLIIELSNNTKLWENNGFSPSEMARIKDRDNPNASIDKPYIRKNKKISRNDPCPCGSGKKYKKCCLAKDE